MLALQRTAGNRAVTQLIQRAPPQPPAPPTAPVTPKSLWKNGVEYPPKLVTLPDGSPMWVYVKPLLRPPVRFVAPGAGGTEMVPEEEEFLRVFNEPPPSGERVGMRALGSYYHANAEQLQTLVSGSDPLPEGLKAEFVIDDPALPWYYRLRIDRVDWENGILFEIKPAHLAEQGAVQVQTYCEAMDRLHPLPGRRWQWRVVTYDPLEVRDFLVRWGFYTRSSLGLPPVLEPAPPEAADISPALKAYMRPTSTAAAAEAAEVGEVVKAGATGGVVFNVVTAVPAIVSLARDLHIADQKPIDLGPGLLEDAGGTYTIGWADGWFWFNDYWKDYVSGSRKGDHMHLDGTEFAAEVAKLRVKYGYFDWTGTFIDGDVPPTYYDPGAMTPPA